MARRLFNLTMTIFGQAHGNKRGGDQAHINHIPPPCPTLHYYTQPSTASARPFILPYPTLQNRSISFDPASSHTVYENTPWHSCIRRRRLQRALAAYANGDALAPRH